MAITPWDNLQAQGVALLKKGESLAAAEAFAAALAAGSDELTRRERALLEVSVVEALMEAGADPLKAEAAAVRAVAADPTLPMAHCQLAKALLLQGKPAWSTASDMLAAAKDHVSKMDAEMVLYRSLLAAGDADARLAALENVLKDSRIGESRRRFARAAKTAGVIDEAGLEQVLMALPAKGSDRNLTRINMGEEQINYGALLEAPLPSLHELCLRMEKQRASQVDTKSEASSTSPCLPSGVEELFEKAEGLMQSGRLKEAAKLAEQGAESQHAAGSLDDAAVLFEFAADLSRDAGSPPEEIAALLRGAFIVIAEADGSDVGSQRLQHICHALSLAERQCKQIPHAAVLAAHAVRSAETAVQSGANAAAALLASQALLSNCVFELGITDMALELYGHVCKFVDGLSKEQIAAVDRNADAPVRLLAADAHFRKAAFFQKMGSLDYATFDFDCALRLHREQGVKIPGDLLAAAIQFYEKDRKDLERAAALRDLPQAGKQSPGGYM